VLRPTVQYAGLAPNFVGLYQFNIAVPSIASNSAASVTFSVSGTASTQTLCLAVQCEMSPTTTSPPRMIQVTPLPNYSTCTGYG
jgi:hypothetical protein